MFYLTSSKFNKFESVKNFLEKAENIRISNSIKYAIILN